MTENENVQVESVEETNEPLIQGPSEPANSAPAPVHTVVNDDLGLTVEQFAEINQFGKNEASTVLRGLKILGLVEQNVLPKEPGTRGRRKHAYKLKNTTAVLDKFFDDNN